MTTFDSIDAKVLNEIVLSLVSQPEAVSIERKVDEMGVLLSVKVDPADMGVLIGRNGIMADSIKTVLRAIGRTNNMNVRVKFLEPEGSTRTFSHKNHDKQSVDKPAPVDLEGELDEFVIK